MIGHRLRASPWILFLAMTSGSLAAAADLPHMEAPSLSPDGRYLAYLSRDDSGRAALDVLDLDRDDHRSRALEADAVEGQVLDWCGWGNGERLLCGIHGPAGDGVSGLVAVNVDGSDRRVLLRQVNPGGDARTRPRAIDFLGGDPKSILVCLHAPGEAYPSVQRLHLYTGALKLEVAAQAPIRHFLLDEQDEVRFGWGEQGDGTIAAFARLGKPRSWRSLQWKRLSRFRLATGPGVLRPLGAERLHGSAVRALGPYEEGESLYTVDLTDQRDPVRLSGHSGPGAGRPLVSAKGRLLGLAFPAGDAPALIYDGRLQNVTERVGQQRPGTAVTVLDHVDNPARFVVQSQRAREPARVHLYGIAGSAFELRELGWIGRGPLPPLAAATASPEAAPSGGEPLDLLVTVVDAAGKPVADLPMRVVLSSDPQPRAAEAGKRYVTDAHGRVRDVLPVRMEARRVELDIPLVTHKARGFELGLEIEMDGVPLLYTLTLDDVKGGTLISDTQVYTHGRDGSFTREVDLTWDASATEDRDVYRLPPRDPKTFDPLPDPPSRRLTQRSLQLLSHPRPDGTKRWSLDLRLSLDPYRPPP